MNRRELLVSAGVVGALLTGCVTDSPAAPGNDSDGPGGATATPDGTDGAGGATDTSAEPTVTGRSFEVTGRGPGNGENEATVSFGDERVTVDGTISGRYTCSTAELEHARYARGDDTLTVAVRSYEPEDAEACGASLVAIEYLSRISFDGGLPGKVQVKHNGELITTARRDRTTDEGSTATPES